jgi:hypothetical protein
MKTIKVKLYDVVTYHKPTDWTSENLIGVVEGGWDEDLIDTPLDLKVFYFMDQDEFNALKEGDDLTGDGDLIQEINRIPDIEEVTI